MLLADGHAFVRRGVRNLLENEADLVIVGEAMDGVQAVQMAEQLQPDILVVDLMMPNLNGLEVLKIVSHRSPRTRKIILSMQNTEIYVVEAFRQGALGYVLKDSIPEELVIAIQCAMRDSKYISPKVSERLHEVVANPQNKSNWSDPFEALTNREREILQMTAEGKTTAEMAKVLSISPRTAELHRSRMMKKLGLHNQAEVLRYALKRGVLSLDT